MFRSSFLIILIQVLGVILGFASIYLVAGDMAPEVYSLVGIYTIINGVVLTFSHLGIETVMMREALMWINEGDIEKVCEYTTQSIISRVMGFILLAPIVGGYLAIMNIYKYDGQYCLLFISFFLGACMNALNDSMSLVVRSQGGYVFSQFAKSLNNSFMKFVAILVYVKYGSMPYLYFYVLYSIPLLFIFTGTIKKYFKFKYVRIKDTISKVKEAKYLIYRSYSDYVYGNADSIIVSALFPPTIMGAYTILKNLEGMIKLFVEGFFDVITQKSVAYKGNFDALCNIERLYNKARYATVALIIVGLFVYSTDTQFFIQLVNLAKYECIESIMYCTALIAICLLIGKYEIAALSVLASTKLNFKYAIAASFISVFSYAWLLYTPTIEGMFLQRISTYLLSSIVGIIIFRRGRLKYYTQILK